MRIARTDSLKSTGPRDEIILTTAGELKDGAREKLGYNPGPRGRSARRKDSRLGYGGKRRISDRVGIGSLSRRDVGHQAYGSLTGGRKAIVAYVDDHSVSSDHEGGVRHRDWHGSLFLSRVDDFFMSPAQKVLLRPP